MNILLDYFFPITTIEPTQAPSTAFLKQVCVVAIPNGGGSDGAITLCTSKAEVAAVTDNTEADELFDAGMSRVYVLQSTDLDIDADLEGHESDFFTLLISSDYNQAAVDAADFGAFEGVIGVSDTDDTWLATWAATANRCGFHTDATNKAKNMFYAFGKMLSNALAWRNQQYITMPYADDVDTLGEATALFDDKISFVMDDTEYGKRLGLFAAGAKAITAPYIKRNLELDLQGAALSYVSGNQPEYTPKHAALLEDELQKVIVEGYIDTGLITDGTAEVKLEQDNFVASGYFNIAEPKALWRIFGEMRQTL